MADRATTSRADDLYRRLRSDILNGRLLPGTKLHMTKLCQEYGISSGVLREALPRLVGEGLAVAEPQRGYQVMEISVEDLQQLAEVRILIEGTALRQSVEHGDVGFESALVAAHHTLSRTEPLNVDGTVREAWLEAHSEFHHALLAGCPNLRLQAIAAHLRDSTEVYRCWSGKLGGGDRGDRDVAGEHRRILEETVSRDADKAVAELTAHIAHTTTLMIDVQSRLDAGGARAAG
jgi:DNA-binding GntR family transcriptional regulator